MSRVKNPQEKKRLSLRKDHRTFAFQGDKTFRTAWRRKKAKTNRQFRRAGTMALTGVETEETPDRATMKPKRVLKKHNVMALGEAISRKEARRHRDKRRAERPSPSMVPDARTAINLLRIMWQATHPEPKRDEAHWHRSFRAEAHGDLWIIKERNARTMFFISRRDGQFLGSNLKGDL